MLDKIVNYRSELLKNGASRKKLEERKQTQREQRNKNAKEIMISSFTGTAKMLSKAWKILRKGYFII